MLSMGGAGGGEGGAQLGQEGKGVANYVIKAYSCESR